MVVNYRTSKEVHIMATATHLYVNLNNTVQENKHKPDWLFFFLIFSFAPFFFSLTGVL